MACSRETFTLPAYQISRQSIQWEPDRCDEINRRLSPLCEAPIEATSAFFTHGVVYVFGTNLA
jgi:hypothetical protein